VDPLNGKFEGWVYVADMTQRAYRDSISMVWMTVDKFKIGYRQNYTDSMPLMELEIKFLQWPCASQQFVCSPEQYILSQEEHMSFDAKQKLLKTSLLYIHQTPANDPLFCSVLSFENPTVRSRSSELICALNNKTMHNLKLVLSSAFYMALDEVDMDYIPMSSSLTEIFKLRVCQEGLTKDLQVTFDA